MPTQPRAAGRPSWFVRVATAGLNRRPRGQSVVEFALIAPVMIVLLLAIVDLARVYTTIQTVDSAAREAADFATFGSQKWAPSVYSLVPGGTEESMKRRACVAASKLPDYVGPDDSCSNPSFSYLLSGDLGATWAPFDPALGCNDPAREPPCWVRVTLHYDFHLIAPLNISILGATIGFPSTISLDRSSTFAMTDLSLP